MQDDPFNCGGCGNRCDGKTPVCEVGKCVAAPCTSGSACSNGNTCCGSACCTSGQICCVVEGGPIRPPECVTPTPAQPSCPVGCPQCG